MAQVVFVAGGQLNNALLSPSNAFSLLGDWYVP
jgi:hypothetical protein